MLNDKQIINIIDKIEHGEISDKNIKKILYIESRLSNMDIVNKITNGEEISKIELVSELLYEIDRYKKPLIEYTKEKQNRKVRHFLNNIFKIINDKVLNEQEKDLSIIKEELLKHGCDISGVTTMKELEENKNFQKFVEPYKNPKYIKDVIPKFGKVDRDINVILANIDNYIEKPLQKAFIELYKKGYKTINSSCNYTDLENEIGGRPIGYIVFRDRLPWRFFDKYDGIDAFKRNEKFFIYEVLTPNMTIEEFSENLYKKAKALPPYTETRKMIADKKMEINLAKHAEDFGKFVKQVERYISKGKAKALEK